MMPVGGTSLQPARAQETGDFTFTLDRWKSLHALTFVGLSQRPRSELHEAKAIIFITAEPTLTCAGFVATKQGGRKRKG